MAFEVIQPVESPDQIAEYYQIIGRAVGGDTSNGELWLIKQDGWIVTAAYSGCFYAFEDEERLIKTLLDYGYQAFNAVALSKVSGSPNVLTIPATVLGMEDFKYNVFWWYVWFAGRPDWFILIVNSLDIIIVGGKPNFVRRVLGCEPDEAFKEIREMSESENLDPVVRKYYSHLLKQLQITYPQLEPGTIINLGLPD
jgi:hypothetical protein